MRNFFFYFTRSEKRAVIFLIVLIIIVSITGYYYPELSRKEHLPENQDNLMQEYTDFLESLKIAGEVNASSAGTQKKEKKAPVLSAFDPNTADSVTFLQLGLPPWMVGNIIRYRTKGGKFRRAEDFRKIYGLTEEQYRILQPYITIAETNVAQKEPVYIPAAQDTPVNVPSQTTTKYPPGTIMSLNEADTTELKKIPGIGSGISNRIVDYRNRLGGFYSVEQLTDINLDSQKLSGWFDVDASRIKKINLNAASIERLRKHPYINFYQAKAIVELRKKRGQLSTLDQLILLEEFTDSDFERIKHYICFE